MSCSSLAALCGRWTGARCRRTSPPALGSTWRSGVTQRVSRTTSSGSRRTAPASSRSGPSALPR
eukprot:SM011101S18860  [mRNA]  locus=s11101:132:422:+ [translate_table: standard]